MNLMSDIEWPVIVNIISAVLLALLGYGLGLLLKVVPKLTNSIAKIMELDFCRATLE